MFIKMIKLDGLRKPTGSDIGGVTAAMINPWAYVATDKDSNTQFELSMSKIYIHRNT